jgi:RNA polymerase sigma-70 factor (ECF subfamily)
MIAFLHSGNYLYPACMTLSSNQPFITPELLARVGQADASAFAQLYEQSSSVLFTLAVRILTNADEASELLQDVYIEVWRKAANFDSKRGSPMAWLITLTRSRAIDRLRASASRGRHLTDSIDDTSAQELPGETPDPLEIHSKEELRTLVTSAFTDLPAAQQEAIELAFYEGLTHAEIAEKLHKPLGTIKTRIKLGMAKLRYALRPCWEMK